MGVEKTYSDVIWYADSDTLIVTWYGMLIVTLYDTLIVTWYGMLIVTWYGMLIVTWYDTLMVPLYDTPLVTLYDTLMVTWYDTLIVTWYDMLIAMRYADSNVIWYTLSICLGVLRKITKSCVSVSSLRTTIWTRDHLNLTLQHHHQRDDTRCHSQCTLHDFSSRFSDVERKKETHADSHKFTAMVFDVAL
jgi:hypothetical protein